MVKKMKVLGLILELNPLHNGHNYFIKKSIDEVNPDYTVAIITSSFSMRGDINVVNKFERTKNLLDLGIDVVLNGKHASLSNKEVKLLISLVLPRYQMPNKISIVQEIARNASGKIIRKTFRKQ